MTELDCFCIAWSFILGNCVLMVRTITEPCSRRLLFYSSQHPSPLLVTEPRLCFGRTIFNHMPEHRYNWPHPPNFKVESDWLKPTGESHPSSQVIGWVQGTEPKQSQWSRGNACWGFWGWKASLFHGGHQKKPFLFLPVRCDNVRSITAWAILRPWGNWGLSEALGGIWEWNQHGRQTNWD